MALRTNDERTVVADAALEVAIASLLTNDDGLDRVGALRLLTKRMVRKNTTNKTRIRTSATN